MLKSRKLTPARNFGFFPTPDAPAERMMDEFSLTAESKGPRLRVLEPSAGTGALARRAADLRWRFKRWSGGVASASKRYHLGTDVTCIEIQPTLASGLNAADIYARVLNLEFLSAHVAVLGLYDRVFMNLHFDRERDIDHVKHALDS